MKHHAPAAPVGSLTVAHLSTSLTGGAAVAAQRICLAQRGVGIDVRLLYRGGISDVRDPTDDGILQKLELTPVHLLSSRVATRVNRAITVPPSILFTPFEATVTSRRLRRHISSFSIVNLHNTYNFVSLKRVLRATPLARVVFTLHDERALTAGCHYSLGCQEFRDSCSDCPQCRFPRVLDGQHRVRQMVGADSTSVSFVSPSRWLRDQAIAGGMPPQLVSHIPNPIDPEDFPLKDAAADATDWLTVGWLPGKLEEPVWEAFSEATDRISACGRGRPLRLLTTTEARVPEWIETVRVPPPSNEQQRSAFWARADIGLSLTGADNFPNVVLEALCVGTPFLINDVGGAGEAVTLTGGGKVLSGPLAHACARELVTASQNPMDWAQRGASAASAVRRHYSPEVIGTAYARHYESLSGVQQEPHA